MSRTFALVVSFVIALLLMVVPAIGQINVVTDFGADPTGVSDSAAAFRAAVASIPAVPGSGAIYVPAGTYKFATVHPSDPRCFVSIGRRVHLYGDGPGTTTIRVDGDSAAAFVVGPDIAVTQEGSIIENLQVYRNPNTFTSTSSNCAGVLFGRADLSNQPGASFIDIEFRNVRFSRHRFGVRWGNESGNRLVFPQFGCKFINCTFDENSAYGIYADNSILGLSILNCVFRKNGTDGAVTGAQNQPRGSGAGVLAIAGFGGASGDMLVDSCSFLDNGGYGLAFAHAVYGFAFSGARVSNCNFERNIDEGLSATSASNLVIDNCQFSSNASRKNAANAMEYYAIWLGGPRDVNGDAITKQVSISNCILRDNAYGGVRIHGADDVSLIGVQIKNCPAPIVVWASSVTNNLTISGCSFSGPVFENTPIFFSDTSQSFVTGTRIDRLFNGNPVSGAGRAEFGGQVFYGTSKLDF